MFQHVEACQVTQYTQLSVDCGSSPMRVLKGCCSEADEVQLGSERGQQERQLLRLWLLTVHLLRPNLPFLRRSTSAESRKNMLLMSLLGAPLQEGWF
jgi:hypothetical protein